MLVAVALREGEAESERGPPPYLIDIIGVGNRKYLRAQPERVETGRRRRSLLGPYPGGPDT